MPEAPRDWAWLRSPLARFNLLAILAYGLLALLVISRVQNGQDFLDVQIAWYLLWEAILFVFFFYNQRQKTHAEPFKQLLLFWGLQGLWFALGLALFGLYFSKNPVAIHGVLGWILGNYILAALAQSQEPELKGSHNEKYFEGIFKRKMPD